VAACPPRTSIDSPDSSVPERRTSWRSGGFGAKNDQLTSDSSPADSDAGRSTSPTPAACHHTSARKKPTSSRAAPVQITRRTRDGDGIGDALSFALPPSLRYARSVGREEPWSFDVTASTRFQTPVGKHRRRIVIIINGNTPSRIVAAMPRCAETNARAIPALSQPVVAISRTDADRSAIQSQFIVARTTVCSETNGPSRTINSSNWNI